VAFFRGNLNNRYDIMSPLGFFAETKGPPLLGACRTQNVRLLVKRDSSVVLRVKFEWLFRYSDLLLKLSQKFTGEESG